MGQGELGQTLGRQSNLVNDKDNNSGKTHIVVRNKSCCKKFIS